MKLYPYLAFCSLSSGVRFRFHYSGGLEPYPNGRTSAEVYTKRSHGWYQDERGKRCRTGRLSAVVLEPLTEDCDHG